MLGFRQRWRNLRQPPLPRLREVPGLLTPTPRAVSGGGCPQRLILTTCRVERR